MTYPISITNGIFQGDSLSPLIVCLALAPLSNLLNNTGMGYSVIDVFLKIMKNLKRKKEVLL